MQLHIGTRRVILPVAACLAFMVTGSASAADIDVTNGAELDAAMDTAQAGDVIRLAAGSYDVDAAFRTGNNGTVDMPITITAASLGDATLNMDTVEGLVIEHAYWIIENLVIDCVGSCDAGVHVKEGADGLVLRTSRLSNFVQHVKASRTPDDEVDGATIAGCEFFNTATIGGTPIDIVGGTNWHIVGNYVHDYVGDSADYAMFLKGATSDGLIERNLVICARDMAPFGGAVGISFGGGLTGSQFCPNNDCSCEDTDSIARNNLVLNCNDAGLHTNFACGSKFYNNTVYNTGIGLQIQANGNGAAVEVMNNVFSHRLTGDDNVVESNNRFDVPNSEFDLAYGDPLNADLSSGPDPSGFEGTAMPLSDVPNDYCGTARDAANPDLGAIEFPAACDTWPWMGTDGSGAGPGTGGGGEGGSASSGSGAGGDSSSAGSGAGDGSNAGDAGDDGGCACRIDADAPVRRGWWLLLIAMAGMARRRRQH